MQPEFWLEAWQTGRTAFHEAAPHADLVVHAAQVFPRGSVLIPLCGATHDLGWLAEQGWSAVGVELSPIAVDQLIERYGLEPRPARGPFAVHANAQITVLCGDFFALQPEFTGPLVGIWDRAALVAMHPDQRAAYVAVEQRVGPDAALLLNVLDYDASKLDGPPWATSDAAVRQLWGALELLDVEESPAQGRFAEHVEVMIRRLYRSLP